MKDRRLAMGIGIGLAVFLGFVGLFLLTHERVELSEDVGYKGLARVNPYLAAERMLRRLEVPASTWFELLTVPDEGAPLILLSRSIEERQALSAQVLDWVGDQGGWLVVVAVPQDDDPFMQAAQARLDSTDEDASDPLDGLFEELDEEVERSDAWAEWADAAPVREISMNLPDGSWESATVQGNGDLSSQRNDFTTWPDQQRRGFVVDGPYESGWITVVADTGAFTNAQIGEHDHARVLATLVTDPESAVFLIRGGSERLSSLIWKHAWMVVVSLGALLLAWIAWALPRFGPVQPDRPPVRRSLLEHVEAIGAYHWRNGEVDRLLGPLRRGALARLVRKVPEIESLVGEDRVRRIAEMTGTEHERVSDLLYGAPTSAAQFTKMTSQLKDLGR